MSTDPYERIEYWKKQEGCTSGTVLKSGLTYDQASALEQQEAKRLGCRQSGGGPRVSEDGWSVYYMSGCD